jgi:hypothetical protein
LINFLHILFQARKNLLNSNFETYVKDELNGTILFEILSELPKLQEMTLELVQVVESPYEV